VVIGNRDVRIIDSKDGLPSVVTSIEVDSPTATTDISKAFQEALIVAQKGSYRLHDSYVIPDFQNDDEVMIRNSAVGLNPIDWKSVEYNFCLPEFPWVCEDHLCLVTRLMQVR
jgi:hypothetical protein